MMKLWEVILTIACTLLVQRLAERAWQHVDVPSCREHVVAALSSIRASLASRLRSLANLVDVRCGDVSAVAGFYPAVETSALLALPPDILHAVLSYCDARSLSMLDRTSRQLHMGPPGTESPIERAVNEVEQREYGEAAGVRRAGSESTHPKAHKLAPRPPDCCAASHGVADAVSFQSHS